MKTKKHEVLKKLLDKGLLDEEDYNEKLACWEAEAKSNTTKVISIIKKVSARKLRSIFIA